MDVKEEKMEVLLDVDGIQTKHMNSARSMI
jgi:hypothetical protein